MNDLLQLQNINMQTLDLNKRSWNLIGQLRVEGQVQVSGQARGPAPTAKLSLPDVVHRFKSMTTKRYSDGVKQYGWPQFFGRLWQRNYYEHIIRTDKSLDHIRQYILDNPMQWESDELNLDGVLKTAPRATRNNIKTYHEI